MKLLLVSAAIAVYSSSALSANMDGCWALASVRMQFKSGKINETPSDCVRLSKGGKFINSCRGGAETTVYAVQGERGTEFSFSGVARYVFGDTAELPQTPPRAARYSRAPETLVITLGPSPLQGPDPVMRVDQNYRISDYDRCASLVKYLEPGGAVAQRPSQIAQGSSAVSSTSRPVPVAQGKYGAPDLMGFYLGAEARAALNQLNTLRNDGFQLAQIQKMTDASGTSQGVVAFKGLRGEGMPQSFLILLYEPDSTVRVTVRGERFVNPPFRADFAASLKAKFGAPQWAMDFLTIDVNDPNRESAVWAVYKGRPVKLAECYSGNQWQKGGRGWIHQSVSTNDYMKIEWQSLTGKGFIEMKPNFCEYAVMLRFERNSGGNRPGELVQDYSLTLIDMVAAGSSALDQNRAVEVLKQRERDNIRNSSAQPKF